MRVLSLFLLMVGAGCVTSRPHDDLRGCASGRLAEPVEGFELRFQPDSLESVVASQIGMTIEEIYGGTLTEYVERSISALRSEAEDGADLWWFDGPRYPSWEGVAAVRDCEIVETWVIMQA